MASWKKTITTPFRKACTFFNQQPPRDDHNRKKSHDDHQREQEEEDMVMNLQVEVMACGYEDVQVMWSMLDKARGRPCALTS
ncbi:hypothetical protein SAY87_027022 [Trapa incisa]|uniref:Uncharacterized protein n=2 Tax=Trapa TaxID=22665 RepID=A0AAN7M7S0_TRANT|nr:hypothetical protein SAY87_027022 [Trapa incisa]KAK4799752.1 hypothetical protein SAY86_025117 [Trapa natans]